jgi:ABC-type multidrug transport system ATPase subunit
MFEFFKAKISSSTNIDGSPVLDISNLGCILSSELVVVIENIKLQPGEILVLDSPSGSGKSTVLGLIAGIIPTARMENRKCKIFGQDRLRQNPKMGGFSATGFVVNSLFDGRAKHCFTCENCKNSF